MILAGVIATKFDITVAQWALDNRCPKQLRQLLTLSEAFSHGMGATAIILGVAVLARPTWRILARLAVASLGAGLVANAFKVTYARYRPRDFDFSGQLADTFSHWFPGISAGGALQSLPSAHSAVAAGLAVALARLFPRGRYFFPLLALLAMGQRVESGAHFLSDTLWGAAVGVAIAGLAMRGVRPLNPPS